LQGFEVAIKEVPEKRYDEMLNILPPRIWLGYGCLVGKPISDRICGVTGNKSNYASFFYTFNRYYEGDPMTVQEFVKFDIHTLPVPP
jgi:hypothetical protein